MKTVLFFISSTRHSCKSRLDGICRFARTCDWHVQAVERAYHRIAVKETLEFWRPSGVIVECGNPAQEFNRRAFGNLPVVWFDAKPGSRGEGAYMGLASEEVAHVAARELLDLEYGHLAVVGFNKPIFWSKIRDRVFAQDVRAAGRSLERSFVPDPEATAIDQRKRLIEWLKALPKPCGIFAVNDVMGGEVLEACGQAGVKVPDEVSVLGVDNDETICENVKPTLSSIAPDFEQGGYRAAKLLDDLMKKKSTAAREETFGVVRTVLRESTRRLSYGEVRGDVVTKTLEYIRRKGPQGATVADVVSELGCSRRLAEMRFREATGRSILEAMHDAVFDQACDLLRKGTKPIELPGLLGHSRLTLDRIFLARAEKTVFEWRKELLHQSASFAI